MPASGRGVARVAVAIAAVLLLVRVWYVRERALDLDEYEHAHAAWSVAHGLLPYRDFFEHHPPALYLLASPIFAGRDMATDGVAAIHALLVARAAMWVVTATSLAVVYALGLSIGGAIAGAFAALLLATSSQYLETMLEFRPDVPAVLLTLVAVACVGMGSSREKGPRAHALVAAGGATLGAALLFTQKPLFAVPGFAIALLLSQRRPAVVVWGASTLVPIALTLWWFHARGAAGVFWYYTVTFTGQLNADRLSPFPRLLSNVVQQPAIYALGTAGIVATLRRSSTRATANAGSIDRPTIARTIAWVSVSLVAGIFVIGKAYDQYYALLLPLLAVLGGVFADPIVRWSIDAAEPALHLPQKRGTVCAAAAIGIAAWSLVVSARAFKPIAAQIDDIAYVNAATRPSDMYVGGSPGAALFRPHAWYYFFLTGPFAGSRDYGNLLAALEQGRIEPRIVIRDRYLEQRATPALLAYIDSRYRHVRGDIYLRQSEYGSASLKTSDASERFDRPLTR